MKTLLPPLVPDIGGRMSFTDRARACLLGLALGDAYGRPLEFLRGPRVRTEPVRLDPASFRWTDDTHMALYLARALLSLGPDRLDDDALGLAVGDAFCAWLDDPLMPSTAPGNTCIEGAQNFRRTRDWRSSGIRGSDGCGAVMRVAPVALAFAGSELDRAAAISALVTHAHPNAVEAAVATCRLLRAVLTTGRLDAAQIAEIQASLKPEGDTARALGAALVEGAQAWEGWLHERAIPAGDGGWRSPSALGLAVAACLRWGRDFATAVEKAARIDGDSDSVAALVGMFLGAAGGSAVLPAAWVEATRARAEIEDLASRLAIRGQPWLLVSDLHGRRERLEGLLRWSEGRFEHLRIGLLGDYVDNGPDVRGVLDLILRLRGERGEEDVVAIAGNHDVVCARALATLGTPEGAWWAEKWRRGHWDPNGDTPSRYGAAYGDVEGLACRMPAEHQAFLQELPWVVDTGRWLLVHAGLAMGPLSPQIAELRKRRAGPGLHFEDGLDRGIPANLRGHALENNADPSWDRVVVSAHSGRHHEPALQAPNRIALHASDKPYQDLYAVLLPERRFLRVPPGGEVILLPEDQPPT